MSSARFWLVRKDSLSEEKESFQEKLTAEVIEELTNSGRISDVSVFSGKDATLELSVALRTATLPLSPSSDGNLVKESGSLIILVNANEISFLEEALRLMDRYFSARLTIRFVILSDWINWENGVNLTGVTTLTGALLQRRSPLNPRRAAIERGLMERAELSAVTSEPGLRIEAHLLLVGLLYGRDGLDFRPYFWRLWEGRLDIEDECHNNATLLPIVHEARYRSALATLLTETETKTYGFLIGALESSVLPTSRLLSECHRKLDNVGHQIRVKDLAARDAKAAAIADEDAASQDVLSNADGENIPQESLPVEEKQRDTLLSLFPSCSVDISAYAALFDDSFDRLAMNYSENIDCRPLYERVMEEYNAFLDINGLKPVRLIILGPPSAGKTELATNLSSWLQLPILKITEVVHFVLNWTTERQIGNVDSYLISSWREELVSTLEAKIAEGRKAKDKSPIVVNEDTITPVMCNNLPSEHLRRCFSIFVSQNIVCQRRGYLVDAWESTLFTNLDDDFRFFETVTQGENAGSSETGVLDAIIHCDADNAFLVARKSESVGGSNTKNKEAQNALKAYDALLNTYTEKLAPNEDNYPSRLPLMAHNWLKSRMENGSNVLPVVSIDMSTSPVVENVGPLVVNVIKDMRGKAFIWLPTAKLAELPVVENSDSVDNLENQPLDSPGNQSSTYWEGESTVESVESPNSKIPPLSEAMQQRVRNASLRYNSFLTATVLPVLSAALVRAHRELPDDPISMVADALAAHSDELRATELAAAKEYFDSLLLR